MSKARGLFMEAFSVPRTLRSDEYKSGVFAALQFCFEEIDKKRCPYPEGSVQADAWFAGVDEGHSIADRFRAKSKGGMSSE
jgi:hypothetical protein